MLALPAGDDVLVGVAVDVGVLRRYGGLLEGEIYVLATAGGPAGADGQQSAKGRLYAADLSRDLVGRHAWARTVVPVGNHHAGGRLGYEVAAAIAGVGAGLAEGRDGDVDEGGVQLPKLLVSQAEASQVPGSPVLNQYVGALRQGAYDVTALRRVQVNDGAALAAIGVDEAQAALRAWLIAGEGRHAAGGIAIRRLHLNDVCAQVAEGAWAHLAEAVGEIENAEVVKGCGRLRLGHGIVLLRS